MVCRSTIYRRRKRAEALGCLVDELPETRGKHGHHATGPRNGSWADGITKSSHGYLKVNVGIGHPLADHVRLHNMGKHRDNAHVRRDPKTGRFLRAAPLLIDGKIRQEWPEKVADAQS